MNTFDGGQDNIARLHFTKGREVSIGIYGMTKIIISTENGQIEGVPGFAIFKGERPVEKYNVVGET